MLAREVTNFTAGLVGSVAACAPVVVRIEMPSRSGAVTRGVDSLLVDVIHCTCVSLRWLWVCVIMTYGKVFPLTASR